MFQFFKNSIKSIYKTEESGNLRKFLRFFLNKDTLHFNLAYLVGFVFQVEKKELKLLDIVNDKVLFTKRMDYI